MRVLGFWREFLVKRHLLSESGESSRFWRHYSETSAFGVRLSEIGDSFMYSRHRLVELMVLATSPVEIWGGFGDWATSAVIGQIIRFRRHQPSKLVRA